MTNKLTEPTIDYRPKLVEAAAIINSLNQKIEKLQARLDAVEVLLDVARCPNAGCDNHGTIANGPNLNDEWEPEQCQWCYEKQAALNG